VSQNVAENWLSEFRHLNLALLKKKKKKKKERRRRKKMKRILLQISWC
jgi:hypothetical protein